MARCKICGLPHAVCGPPTTVVPLDQRIETKENRAVPLKRYIVTVQAGRTEVDTILKLTPEEAKRLGGTEYVKGEQSSSSSGAKARPTSANKARPAARNKAATKPAAKPAAAKKSTPPKQTPAKPHAAPTAPAGTDIEDATDPGASE